MADNNSNNPTTPQDGQGQGQGDNAQIDNKAQTEPQGEGKEQLSDKEINFARLREAHEKTKAKLEALEAEKSEAEKKKLEEEGKYKELLEKEKAQREELEAKFARKEQETAIEKALSKAGANQEVLDLAVQALIGQVETDKKGNITNLDQLVAELKSTRPILFAGSDPNGKIGTGVANNSNAGGLTKEQAMKIALNPDKDEYMARKEEVDKLIYS